MGHFTPTVGGGSVSGVFVASGGGSVTFTETYTKTPAKAVSGIIVLTQKRF